jgi:DNA-binding transcriptional MerR regulator
MEDKWQHVKDLAEREGVTVRQVRSWVEKGAVETERLAPRTGVRVRSVAADDDVEE